MLDHLDLAGRRYQMLRRSPAAPPSLEQVKQISLWLEYDVCRIVDELTLRQKFRELCRWPLRHLASGADSPERQLVEAADAGLVAWAAALAKAGRALKHKPVTEALAGVEYVARRPWRDLVAIADYFSPTAELNLLDREAFLGQGTRHVQIAEFLPACNPTLCRPGDFVSRSLLLRVDYWRKMLHQFAIRCHATMTGLAQNNGHVWRGVQKAGACFAKACEALRAVCTGPAPALRSSCMTLLQVYVAYRPDAKLPWLGLPPSMVWHPYWVRHRLEHQRDIEIADYSAAALIDVTPLYREPLDVEAILADQVQARDLVLVMGLGRREVYWRGQLVQADWFARQASWGLLVALAEGAKDRLGVDAFEVRSRSYKDARHRLKRVIPPALDSLIRPCGRGTYRLELAASAISLLEFDSQQRLVELGMS